MIFMDGKVLYKAVAGIEEKHLAASEDTVRLTRAFRKTRVVVKRRLITACACLLVAAGAVSFINSQGGKKGEAPVSELSGTEGSSDTAEVAETLSYRDLTGKEHGISIIRGSGNTDSVAFSEELIRDVMIIEATVIETHRKDYHLVIETGGKLEYAGQRVKEITDPESLITSIRVERVWKGDGSIKPGDIVITENELLPLDEMFCCRQGSAYVLLIVKTSERLVYSGIREDEILLEGDDHRDSDLVLSYPFQPAIERTPEGDYIVPVTWSSIAQSGDPDVTVSEDDLGEDGSYWWYQVFGLKFVDRIQFEERMSALINDIQ